MATFGGYGPFPLRFGGGRRAVQNVHYQALAAWEGALDTSDQGITAAETFAEAKLVANVWAASERMRNQGQPLKMLEALPDWEDSTRLRPKIADTDNSRRGDLAAKLRGLGKNSVGDIRDACSTLLGSNFVRIYIADPAEEIVHWMAQLPGHPGLEWSSTRAKIRVEVTRTGLEPLQFSRLIARLTLMLDALCPAWMTFDWYIEDTDSAGAAGFVLGQSQLGVHGL